MGENFGTVLASHQPDFFPYMGYFYKVFLSDIFVFSDDVLYSKTGRHNYNEILTANGPHRFTLPIHCHVQKLNEILVAGDEVARKKMMKTLQMEYHKAAHFGEVFPVLAELLGNGSEEPSLAVFNHRCLMELMRRFGLTENREFYISSELHLEHRRDARIIEMCKRLGANVYISGTGAKDYHIERDYADNGIKLVYSDYQPIKYPQVGGREVENLSVIDYVFNCGFQLPKEWRRNVR